jgi:hypothetical protein
MDVDLRSSLLMLDKTNKLVMYSLNRRLGCYPYLQLWNDKFDFVLKSGFACPAPCGC